MSNENKTDDGTVVVTETETQVVPAGPRGEVGKATAKLTLVQLWHNAHFNRHDIGDRTNPRKREWRPKPGGAPSLKQFARKQVAAGNEVAKEWFFNKSGGNDQSRSDKNKSRIMLEKQASKAARKKKSQKPGTKAATDTAVLKAV